MKKKPNEETMLKVFLQEYESTMYEKTGHKPLISEWEYIVGPVLYKHVFLETYDERKIVVKSEHPSYTSVLKMQERQILARLKEKFPQYNIKRIQVY